MQSVGVPPWREEDLIQAIPEFLPLYDARPVRDNRGGNQSVGMFYVWFTARALRPSYIIESGIWKGATTWLLEQAAPQAEIFALDPVMRRREYKSPRVKYSRRDFGSHDWHSKVDPASTLVFLDDHQDMDRRLRQAVSFKFRHLLIDDNYPEPSSNRHKTLEMLLRQGDDFARQVVQTYFVFPPLYRYTDPVTKERTFIEGKPLLEGGAEFPVLRSDMHTYRWTTYVRLEDAVGDIQPEKRTLWQKLLPRG